MTKIIERLPFPEYLSIKALSNSHITAARRSMAHLKALLDEPRKDSPALLMGRAFHTLVLEPDNFNDLFYKLPKLDLRKTRDKQIAESLKAGNVGKDALTDAQYEDVFCMAESIKSGHISSRLIAPLDIQAELSLFWNQHGVDCKARPDAYNKKFNCFVDIKTTENAAPRSFAKSIFNFGYYRQAAFYLEGAKFCGLDVADFVFIAVEKSPPYAVAIYRLQDDVIALAKKEIEPVVARYRECLEKNFWPAYSQEVQDIGVPSWATGEITDNIYLEA